MNFKKSIYEKVILKASGKKLKEITTLYEGSKFNVVVKEFYLNNEFNYGIVIDSYESKQRVFSGEIEQARKIILDMYGICE
ncbi:MAG: hypothetical protein ACRC1T_09795 [Clostridium chrysemydis]|uniref:hypothetical protein n=1 Tax=Clostridium chrysemydis TaxID=2665504 RepID=UPI003F3C8897